MLSGRTVGDAMAEWMMRALGDRPNENFAIA
jgi:hypothetical protein